jgi:hypothetical protein
MINPNHEKLLKDFIKKIGLGSGQHVIRLFIYQKSYEDQRAQAIAELKLLKKDKEEEEE